MKQYIVYTYSLTLKVVVIKLKYILINNNSNLVVNDY